MHRLRVIACSAAVVALLVIGGIVQAQTFTVLHYFTGNADGGNPAAGLTPNGAGNFYGTASTGGPHGHGSVFRFVQNGSGGVVTPMYGFAGGKDGEGPGARVVIGPNGTLYGTTVQGGGTLCVDGNDNVVGCGVVFQIVPASICRDVVCSGTETVLYRFQGGADGATPNLADLVLDNAGNIYGTTLNGGYLGSCFGDITSCGVVYKLSHTGNSWTESVIHTFKGPPDGFWPFSGVIIDNAGNLYGTTGLGGRGGGLLPPGTVYRLAPSGSDWTETILHSFLGDASEGASPVGGLILDSTGKLYGTTIAGGSGGGGTVFSMAKTGGSFQVLYSFESDGDGVGPYGSLAMDSAGNLYGTTLSEGAFGHGNIFKLSPSNNGWVYTSLHDFTGGTDGASPESTVSIDKNGNLYGTASLGGKTGSRCDPFDTHQCGVIWEITQ